MTIENRISEEQATQAAALLDKLKPEDRANVEIVTKLLNEFVEHYDSIPPGYDNGGAVFGAYLIGGWTNKEAPRPDVDLLLMTSVRWDMLGYIPIESEGKAYFGGKTNGDKLVQILAEHFANNGFAVELPDEIPDEYSEGAEPRVLIRLTPEAGNPALPIDLVYVSGGYSELPIRSLEDFYELDASAEGADLGRVALVEAIVTKPILRMRL